jgi:hypothetical protein
VSGVWKAGFLLAAVVGLSGCGGSGGGGESNPLRSWLASFETNIENESLVKLGETIDDDFLNQPVGGGCINKAGYLADLSNVFVVAQTLDVQVKEIGKVTYSGAFAEAYVRMVIRGKAVGSSVWEDTTVDGYITLRQDGSTWLLYGNHACSLSPNTRSTGRISASPLRIVSQN